MRKGYALAVITCLIVCFIAGSDEAYCQEGKLPSQKVKPGTLSGMLKDSKGNNLAGKKIVLVDEAGNEVGSATTTKHGLYRIENLPEGNFTMKVGEKEVAKLQVSKDATLTRLMVVMPKAAPFSNLTMTEWTLIGVGGAAVLVAIPVIAHNRDSSSSNYYPPISP